MTIYINHVHDVLDGDEILDGEEILDGAATTPKSVKNRRQLVQVLLKFKNAINIEPVIFIFVLVASMNMSIVQLFIYWSRCIEFIDKYDPEKADWPFVNRSNYCKHLSLEHNATSDEDYLQRDVAKWSIIVQIFSILPGIIVTPILSLWSDKGGGRKKPIMLSMFGMTIHIGTVLGAIIFYQQLIIYVPIIIGCFLMSASGGYTLFFSCSSTMVFDEVRGTCNDEMLDTTKVPLRIAIVSSIKAICNLLGPLIVTLLRQAYDVQAYLLCTLINIALLLVAIIYCQLFVRETLITTHNIEMSGEDGPRFIEAHSFGAYLRYFRACSKELLSVFKRQRPGHLRYCINLSLISVAVEYIVFDQSLLMLYTKRAPFNWSDTNFLYYSIYLNVLNTLGAIFWPSLSQCLYIKAQDCLMIIIGMFATIIMLFGFSIVKTNALLYMIGGTTFIGSMVSPGLRTLLPRLVTKKETARLHTAFISVLSIMPIFSSTIFNMIYSVSMSSRWPGLVFGIEGVLMIIPFFCQLVIYHYMRQMSTTEYQLAADDEVTLTQHVD